MVPGAGRMRIVSNLLILAAVLAAVGCAGKPPDDAAGPPENYPILPGRFAEQAVSEPLTIIESFIGKENFFVKFDGPDGIVHAGGNWSDRIDIVAVENDDTGTYGGPLHSPAGIPAKRSLVRPCPKPPSFRGS